MSSAPGPPSEAGFLLQKAALPVTEMVENFSPSGICFALIVPSGWPAQHIVLSVPQSASLEHGAPTSLTGIVGGGVYQMHYALSFGYLKKTCLVLSPLITQFSIS